MYNTFVCLRLRMDLSSQYKWHIKPGWFMNALSADTKRNEHRLRCKSTTGTFHSSLHVRLDGCGKRKRGVQASDIPVKARPYQVLFTGVQVAVEWRGWRGERSGQTLSTGGWRGELPLIFYVGSSDCCLLIIAEVLSFNNKTINWITSLTNYIPNNICSTIRSQLSYCFNKIVAY